MAHPIMPAPPNNLIWQRRGGGNMRGIAPLKFFFLPPTPLSVMGKRVGAAMLWEPATLEEPRSLSYEYRSMRQLFRWPDRAMNRSPSA